MAKDRIVKPFLYVSKDQYRIDNIEDMKGVNFALGDVVDLLGYYEAGDGAHHKRKIETADDGSGVRLVNGLWANIVHDGEVRFSWLGISKKTTDLSFYERIKNVIRLYKKNELTFIVDSEVWLQNDEPFTVFKDGEVPPADYVKKHLVLKGLNFELITWAFANEDSAFMRINSQFLSVSVENLKIIAFNLNWISNTKSAGTVFLFNSVQKDGNYLGVTTKNSFKNIEVSSYGVGTGKLHLLDYVFKNIGYGQNDQTLVQNCTFGYFKNCYYSENAEAVNWVFDRCGFITEADGAKFFSFTSMFDNFNVHNSSFGLYGKPDPQIFLETRYVPGDITSYGTNFLFSFKNNRIEHYGAGEIILNKLEFGKAIYEKCNNTLANFDGIVKNYIQRESNLMFCECSMRKAVYEIQSTTPIVSGNLNQNKLHFQNTSFAGVEINLNNDGAVHKLHELHLTPVKVKDYGIVTFENCYNTNGKTNYNYVLNLNNEKNSISSISYTNTTTSQQGIGDNIHIPYFRAIKEIYVTVDALPYSKFIVVFFEGTAQEKVIVVDNPRFNTESKKNFRLLKEKIVAVCYKGDKEYESNVVVYVGNDETQRVRTSGSVTVEFEIGTNHVFSNSIGEGFAIIEGYSFTYAEIAKLDTPYLTIKMQQEGIYEDFIVYMDERFEYERKQREFATQLQLAFEQRENQEQSYEEWLSEQAEVIPLVEPQPSDAIIDFKNRYLG